MLSWRQYRIELAIEVGQQQWISIRRLLDQGLAKRILAFLTGPRDDGLQNESTEANLAFLRMEEQNPTEGLTVLGHPRLYQRDASEILGEQGVNRWDGIHLKGIWGKRELSNSYIDGMLTAGFKTPM